MNAEERRAAKTRAVEAKDRALDNAIGPASIKRYMSYSPGSDIRALSRDVTALCDAMDRWEEVGRHVRDFLYGRGLDKDAMLTALENAVDDPSKHRV